MKAEIEDEFEIEVKIENEIGTERSRCEFLQCTVLGKHGAVSDDVTLRGRDVILFLKQAKIILRCRYAPGMPRPGVSK